MQKTVEPVFTSSVLERINALLPFLNISQSSSPSEHQVTQSIETSYYELYLYCNSLGIADIVLDQNDNIANYNFFVETVAYSVILKTMFAAVVEQQKALYYEKKYEKNLEFLRDRTNFNTLTKSSSTAGFSSVKLQNNLF